VVVASASHAASFLAYLMCLSSGSWTVRSAKDQRKPMYRKEKAKGKCLVVDQGQPRSSAILKMRDSS
jgi:hypothetical protein